MFINTITTNLESLNQQHDLATNFTEDQDSLLHSPMGLSAENHINMIDFLIKPKFKEYEELEASHVSATGKSAAEGPIPEHRSALEVNLKAAPDTSLFVEPSVDNLQDDKDFDTPIKKYDEQLHVHFDTIFMILVPWVPKLQVSKVGTWYFLHYEKSWFS